MNVCCKSYFLLEDLEHQVRDFVEQYNTLQHHESLGNLTPACVYFDRGGTSKNCPDLATAV